jgi:hypothetical protein
VHVTETCDDDTPHVITHVETMMATDQDVTVIDPLHQALEQQSRLPGVHLVDGAYTSDEKLVTSQHDYQIDLMGRRQTFMQNSRWRLGKCRNQEMPSAFCILISALVLAPNFKGWTGF